MPKRTQERTRIVQPGCHRCTAVSVRRDSGSAKEGVLIGSAGLSDLMCVQYVRLMVCGKEEELFDT